MAAKKVAKTNALRELDAAHVPYVAREYDAELVKGEYGLAVARALGEDPDTVFKTLVCQAPDKTYVVCVIPVACELDLKRAAAAARKKSLALIHVKDIEAVTGYVRGGCSPVGMKCRHSTIIDEMATLYPAVAVSGGRRGLQIELDPADLAAYTGAVVADVAREDSAS
jgi:Cys-tRNA(Pro)/Cys-tRNA(Cys) deacylase